MSQTFLPMLPPTALSVQLRGWAARFRDQPVRVGELMAMMQGRSRYLFLILLSLPFLTPVPLPLVSTVVGTVIMFTGLRMTFGRRPWIPQIVQQRMLPTKFIPHVISAAARLVGWLEFLLKPRLKLLCRFPGVRQFTGFLIALAGLLLLLPLPVPFSNFLPAITILLLAAGSLARDGLCLLTGAFAAGVTVTFFILLTLVGGELTQWLRSLL
jgi:hypothetical protein